MGPELRPGAALPGAGPSLLDSPAFPGTAGWEVSHHATKLPGPPAGMPEAPPAPLGSAGTSKDSRTCAFGSSVTFRTAARTRAQAVGSRGTVPVCAGATDAPCALCPLFVSHTSPLLADATCQGPLPCSGSGVSGRVRRMRTGGPSLQAPRHRRLTPASPPCVRKRSPLWNDRVYDARTFLWLPGGLQGSWWPCFSRDQEPHIHLQVETALSPPLPLSLSLPRPQLGLGFSDSGYVCSDLSAVGK